MNNLKIKIFTCARVCVYVR